jgi:hypothetical protein
MSSGCKFLRLLAVLLSLLTAGLCTAGSISFSDRKVAVYLDTRLSSESDSTLVYMKAELEALIRTTGYRVIWKSLANPSEEAHSVIAVVELRGACKPPGPGANVKPVENGASLASTAVENGKILPFSWINCEALSEMLASSLAAVESGQRDFLYGRALGRVMAHELYHLLSNNLGHAVSGVGKASFGASDVLAERFTFEQRPSKPSSRTSTAPVAADLVTTGHH